jgi:hypothetical protein
MMLFADTKQRVSVPNFQVYRNALSHIIPPCLNYKTIIRYIKYTVEKHIYWLSNK